MAAHIREMRTSIDLILCSPSRRTVDTLRPIRASLELGDDGCLIEEGLYAASESTLLDRLRHLPGDAGSVLLIGHNPGLQDLVCFLSAHGDDRFRQRVEEKFPTAALAVFRTSGDWSALGPDMAEPVELVLPRDPS